MGRTLLGRFDRYGTVNLPVTSPPSRLGALNVEITMAARGWLGCPSPQSDSVRFPCPINKHSGATKWTYGVSL